MMNIEYFYIDLIYLKALQQELQVNRVREKSVYFVTLITP